MAKEVEYNTSLPDNDYFPDSLEQQQVVTNGVMMTNAPSVKWIKTSDLSFDPQNPRFYRLNSITTDEDIIEEMLDDESAQDLMASIGQKGYFPGEPLLVTREGKSYIVVEGNRRLAAVKLLNGEFSPPQRRQASVELLRNEAAVEPPKELPCIEYPSRREIMRYLGYRHITGIKEWDALSKARYLKEILQEFYLEFDRADQMKSLARDIGSRADYVSQLLTALELYIKAESANFFGLPMTASDIEFSYLTTALNYKKITDWLGLNGRTDIEMRYLDTNNLKRAFAWMFPKDQQGQTILGESRNLAQLAEVVGSPDAISILESTRRLSEAYLYSEGPQNALITALTQAQERVQTCWTMLPNTKPLTKQHLELAEKLAEDSRSIRAFLREKLED